MSHRRRTPASLALLLMLALLILSGVARSAGAPLDPALAAAVAARLVLLAGPGPAPITTPMRTSQGWVFGTVARPAPDAEAGPLARLFLAEPGSGWSVALDAEPGFADLVGRAPGGLLTAEERALFDGATLAAGGEAQLGMPFGLGESWYLTGGPHPSGFDTGGAWSALDFAGGSGLVGAARAGVAYLPCANLVKVYHPDGFQTGYYHLADIQVFNGQAVERGAVLGRISSEVGCGGYANGDHVHFWLMQDGFDLALHGSAIGGWMVQGGAVPYQGCLLRGPASLCAGIGRIINDGAVGDGSASLAGRYRAAVVGLEYPQALEPGATGTITATLRNTGALAWDASTALAPLPQDTPPALAADSWPGGTRIAAVPGVGPGETATVRFQVRAPATPGVYALSLGMVQEYVAWFAEPEADAARLEITVGQPKLADPPGPERLFLPALASGASPAASERSLWFGR